MDPTNALLLPVIRGCKDSDLNECGALLCAVYADAPYHESWTVQQAKRYLATFFEFDTACSLVASTSEGQLVGALFGFSYPWHTESILFLQELYLHKKMRGLGIARDLIQQAVSQMGGDVKIVLAARQGSAASGFYDRIGLTVSAHDELRVGRVKNEQ